MSYYCPLCGSEDIEQRTTPTGRLYWHCNECNKNFNTPGGDALAASEEAPAAGSGETA